jgi:hypothetical protein
MTCIECIKGNPHLNCDTDCPFDRTDNNKREEKMDNDALIPTQTQAIVKPAGSPAELGQAIKSYRELQETLDAAMPDCIQDIAGKQFRKKNYWRAVKTAFNLKVECEKEERYEESDDWGFMVTYRAIAPNGATADGDGACTFKEKSKGNMQPTLHNIRSQAHTRAFNRAVSNLVGFGEVSAEEMIDDKKPIDKPASKGSSPQGGEEKASEKQIKAIYAIMSALDIADEDRALKCDTVLGLEFGTIKTSKDLTKKQATTIIKALKEEQGE